MTFDELWKEIDNMNMLPDTAIHQVPQILSNKTKILMSLWSPSEVLQMLQESIYEIDHGSVESVDSLLRKRIKCKSIEERK